MKGKGEREEVSTEAGLYIEASAHILARRGSTESTVRNVV